MAQAEPYRVRHCYNGLWVLRYELYSGGSAHCTYQHSLAGSRYDQIIGWCEHVGLLECLYDQNADLHVGISRDLPVHWTSDWTGRDADGAPNDQRRRMALGRQAHDWAGRGDDGTPVEDDGGGHP